MILTERDVVAEVGGLTIRKLRLWVRRGWVCPAQGEQGPAFNELDVARVRLIRQLEEEILVNKEAIPIVLSLMDQVYGLRRELRSIARAVEAQTANVRGDIIERMRDRHGGRTG